MRRHRLPLVLLWLVAGVIGCRSRSDLVEAELRTRDRELREARARLASTEMFALAMERELRESRQCQPGAAVAAGVQPILKGIEVGRQTAGYDDDRIPGDEGIQVVVVPRDTDGHAVKATGRLRITLFDITAENQKLLLSTHEIPAVDLRTKWQAGLLNTGYFVKIPWAVVPHSEKLRVVAEFASTDGRTFENERDVTIRLPHEALPTKPLPPGIPPAAVETGEPAPTPRPLIDPPKPQGAPVAPPPDGFEQVPPPREGPMLNGPGDVSRRRPRTGDAFAADRAAPLSTAVSLSPPVHAPP
jgi:hypothetical protein